MTKPRHHGYDRAADRAILKAAGVSVYEDKEVRRYMEDELLRHPPGLIARRMGDAWSDTIRFFASVAAFLLAVASGQAALGWYGDSLALAGIAILSVAAAPALAFMLLGRTLCRPSPGWATHRLESEGTYRAALEERRVPPFARDLLARIRAVIPDSTFTIAVIGPDPVITCITPRGSYVVLVYDGEKIIPAQDL
jgi:hypothetical protein